MNNKANIIREECLKKHSSDKYLSHFVKKLRELDIDFYSDLKVYNTLPIPQRNKSLKFLYKEYYDRLRLIHNNKWNFIFHKFNEISNEKMQYYFQQIKFLQTITLNVYHAKSSFKK